MDVKLMMMMMGNAAWSGLYRVHMDLMTSFIESFCSSCFCVDIIWLFVVNFNGSFSL